MSWKDRFSSIFSVSAKKESAPLRQVMQEAELQAQFERDGYVIVPFIEKETLAQVLELFEATDSGVRSGYYNCFHSRNLDYKAGVGRELERLCGQLPDRYLLNYRPLFGTLTVKMPDSDSALLVHQDWTFVDETRFVSVNCWMPVTEITPEDGPLMVMKGSHRLFRLLRCSSHLLPPALDGIRDLIRERYLTPLEVKPGEAVLLDNSLVHYSSPNSGSQPRVAAQIIMIPAEATPWHYHHRPDGRVELYEVETEFFYRFILGDEPAEVKRLLDQHHRRLGYVEYEPSAITETQIEQFYRYHY